MDQLLYVRRGMSRQEGRYSLSPGRNHCPVGPLPPQGTGVSVDAGQKLLEEVFVEDQTVPAASLSDEK